MIEFGAMIISIFDQFLMIQIRVQVSNYQNTAFNFCLSFCFSSN